MRAAELELMNFCQHRHKVLEFHPGLNAIIGPNGSGKSNVMGAMKYALIGEHPNAGGKDANICQGTPATERSYVRFTFFHGDVRATVQRNLRPATPTTLQVAHGGKPIRGDGAVNAWILNLLVTDNQIIDDIVIVDQGDIFGFLSQRPATRAKSFAKLFGTDKAELAWDAFGKQMSTVTVPALPIDLGAVNSAIAQDEQRREEIAVQSGGRTAQEIRNQIVRENMTITAWNNRVDKQKLRGQLGERRLALIQEQTNAQEAKAKADINVSTLKAAAENSAAGAKQAEQALALIAQARQYEQQRRVAMTNIAEYERQLLDLVDPTAPPDYGRDWDLLLQDVRDDRAKCKERMASLVRSLADAVCATCDTAIDHDAMPAMRSKLAEATARVPQLSEREEQLLQGKLRSNTYEKRLSEVRADRRRVGELLKAAQQRLEDLEAVAIAPVTNEDVLQSRVAEHAEYVAAIATYQEEASRHAATVAQYTGQIRELDTQIEAADTTISNILVTREQANIANAEHARLSVSLPGREAMERELAEIDTRLAHNRQLVLQCNAVGQEITTKRAWLQKAERMRAVVHRNAAPRAVAHRNLQRLRDSVNGYLSMFDTDFRVSATTDLTFTAHFTDGREQPAARLSGGQKVILALGFRLAVNFMYANLGFLALDEPTAYLDAHHIAGFQPVLDRLRGFASSRGLQCVMVTHEQALAPLFDHVIQL